MSHKHLRKLVNKHHLRLVTVLEPFQRVETIIRYAQLLDLSYYCCNEDKGGKIWIMWSVEIFFDVVHIYEKMIMGWTYQNISKILASFVYAKCGFYDQRKLWTTWRVFLVGPIHGSWLVGLIASKMMGRESVVSPPRRRITTEEYYKCIDRCGLVEINSFGGYMSWTNGQEGRNSKWNKLDWAMVNLTFL